jgi:hypothetical protein
MTEEMNSAHAFLDLLQNLKLISFVTNDRISSSKIARFCSRHSLLVPEFYVQRTSTSS